MSIKSFNIPILILQDRQDKIVLLKITYKIINYPNAQTVVIYIM